MNASTAGECFDIFNNDFIDHEELSVDSAVFLQQFAKPKLYVWLGGAKFEWVPSRQRSLQDDASCPPLENLALQESRLFGV